MKTYTFILLIAFFTFTTPFNIEGQRIGDLHGINYQAVAIDTDGKEIVGMDMEGKPLYEKEIGIRFTLQNGPEGTILYQETHTALTDQHGLFSLTIGKGNQTDGVHTHLLDIPWINADQWLKVEMSLENDGNYRTVSQQQFMAVPYSFYSDDIADDAITTEKILDYTILNQDIDTGAINTRTILNETILNEDMATGAIDTRTILDSTIINRDVATGAIDSRTILDGTIQNEDIQNATIDLTTKVNNILSVENGGTGLDGSLAADGQLLIGNGTDGDYDLATLTSGTGILITNSPGGIQISSTIQAGGVNTQETGLENIGDIDATKSFVTQVALPGVEPGDFVVASYSLPLEGCLISGYVRNINEIEVVIYNANDTTVNLGEGTFKVLVIK